MPIVVTNYEYTPTKSTATFERTYTDTGNRLAKLAWIFQTGDKPPVKRELHTSGKPSQVAATMRVGDELENFAKAIGFVLVSKSFPASQLSKGDLVSIFADPITAKNLEGKAELVERIGNVGVPAIAGEPVYESWQVRFDSDSRTFARVVCSRDIINL